MAVGIKTSGAASVARDWLGHPEVRDFIRAEQEALADVCRVEVHDILRRYLNIIAADPNDLVQHRRTCCRHCYSYGFGFKRTVMEARLARADHERAVLDALVKNPEAIIDSFDERGGDDFDATLDPDPDCTECFGAGQGSVHVADTRDLSRTARALYAGVKTTKNGIEVLMHSKEKALEMVGRHLGMFTDVIEVNDPHDVAGRIVEARRRAGGR